jgi:long-subunit fatty acid transport protein
MKKISFLFCFSLLLIAGNAQDKTSLGIQYQYALPMGGFKTDFVEKGSPRGIGIDLLYTINPKWRVGGALSYQDFYQKTDRALYPMEDGSTISAVVSNSLQNTTLMGKAMFLPTPEKRLQPYVSAGVGVNMAQVNQALGVFDNINDANFGFAAQGGAGILYGLGEKQRTSLTAGVQYNVLPFNKHNISGLNNLTFGVGARFTLKQGSNNSRDNDDDDWNRGRRMPRRYGW